jgi:hypothetical protein
MADFQPLFQFPQSALQLTESAFEEIDSSRKVGSAHLRLG